MRRGWPIALYLLLVVSAGLAVYAQRSAGVDPLVAKASSVLFLAFAVGFAIYRFALVAARKYSPFKAFFQVFIAALFFMVLLWPAFQPPRKAGASPLVHALSAIDAEKRALAAELAGHRRDVAAAPRLVELLSDSAPAVRAAAHGALVRLNDGLDLGSGDDEASKQAWKERF